MQKEDLEPLGGPRKEVADGAYGADLFCELAELDLEEAAVVVIMSAGCR
ncbi:MAG: hypothetical protein ACYCSX_03285 [Acidimicrobiales bacterium]